MDIIALMDTTRDLKMGLVVLIIELIASLVFFVLLSVFVGPQAIYFSSMGSRNGSERKPFFNCRLLISCIISAGVDFIALLLSDFISYKYIPLKLLAENRIKGLLSLDMLFFEIVSVMVAISLFFYAVSYLISYISEKSEGNNEIDRIEHEQHRPEGK